MAVYVDDLYKTKAGKLGKMKMSHMIADSTEELLDMADRINVNRKWIQYKGTPKEHFDISLKKRSYAVRYGAIEITWKELGRKILDRANNDN